MKALRWDGQALRLDHAAPEPERTGGRAVLRVRLAGICRTDIEILAGYLGFRGVPGHECVGTVVESPRPEQVGQRVVPEINFGCGRCVRCAAGLRRHCPERSVMGIVGADGAFAEFVAVPPENLHVVPPEVDDLAAVFVEPLAAAFEILEQIHLTPPDRVVVLGDGKLGQLVARVLGVSGSAVTLLGHHPVKLEMAAACGVEVAAEQGWRGEADVVVEATGRGAGLARALEIVRPRGTIVLKSTVAGSHQLDLAPAVVNEVTIVGSRCGSYAPALRALAAGSVTVRPLVTATFPLEHGLAALARAGDAEAMKVVLAAVD